MFLKAKATLAASRIAQPEEAQAARRAHADVVTFAEVNEGGRIVECVHFYAQETGSDHGERKECVKLEDANVANAKLSHKTR